MSIKLLNQYEKPGRPHYKILFLSWAGWIFDFYDLILFTFLLIPLGSELGLSQIQLSLAIGVSLGATALGGVIFGLLSDRYGRRPVLQLTIIVYSLGTFLCGFSFGLTTLVLFRIITGLGVGGEWATGQTYIGETFPAKYRGRYSSLMQTGAPLGVLLASLVGGFLTPLIGWRLCFIVSVLPALLVIFIRRGLPESDVWLLNNKNRSYNNYKHIKGGLSKFSSLFTKKYRKIFILALILAILGLSTYWFTYSWLPDYLYQERGFSLAKSALWIVITQVGGLIGYLSFGFVADYLGRRPAFTIYTFIMALGLSMVTILWDLFTEFPGMILIFMFMIGFGTGFFGGYGALFSELFPTSIRSTASGSAFNIGRGVQFFTPLIIVLISQIYDIGAGIFLAAIFAMATGTFIWLFPETKATKLKELEKI
ncbi:MAG: MFS transporter [Methanobacteriaceae archaeon]|nr:MFS transporter [Methanobacteriaceae archaeon]